MSPDVPEAWQWSPLKCKNAPDGVQLYYEFSDCATELFVAVTDLCSVWDVSIDRDGVVENAREQNCSIDPAESATQLRTLLSKLKQSLAEGSNNIGHSECHEGGEKHQTLILRTRLKLPTPLRLLQWTFNLLQRDKKAVAESITFPLVQKAKTLKQQMETLYQVIKEKDHVLSKLLDKIDNSATDLSLIFPGISGLKSRKQRIDVVEASKHVPGMAAFDRKSWEASMAKTYSVIGSGSIDLSKILDSSTSSTMTTIPQADWLQTMPSPSEDSRMLDHSSSETDNEALEAGPKPFRSASAQVNNSHSSTDSEFEDLADAPRRRRRNLGQVKDPGSSPSPRKTQSKQPASSSPISATHPQIESQKHEGFHSSFSSNSDSDLSMKRSAKTSQKSTTKIGMIGGKRKASQTPQSQPAAPISGVSTPLRKLGVLKGRRAPTKSSSKSPVPFRARSETMDAPNEGADSETASSTSSAPDLRKRPENPSVKVATTSPANSELPEVEESVEEKAKRKRVELKQMQTHANTGLAKKKVRRF